MKNRILRGYGSFIARRPFTMLALVLAISLITGYGSSQLQTIAQDQKDILPDNVEVIQNFRILESEFGSSDNVNIVVQLDPDYASAKGIKDIRNPQVIEYLDLLEKRIAIEDGVISTRGIADSLRTLNSGQLPKSKNEIESLLKKSVFSRQQISDDYSLTVIGVRLIDNFDEREMYDAFLGILNELKPPAGIIVGVSADFAVNNEMEEKLGSDMNRTSTLSALAILFVIIFIFRSARYGLSALSVIIFGVMWAFGLMGLLGINLTSMTSGAASMVMGIGIDFGIQLVTRFRQEIRSREVEDAMSTTINAITIPMSTTTIAALIGLNAMSLGNLKFLGDLGIIMSIGVFGSMMAALTIAPTLLVINERYLNQGIIPALIKRRQAKVKN